MKPRNSSKIPMPPMNPKDPFLKKLASAAANSPETFLNRPLDSDSPPYLDLFDSPTLMATPAQVLLSLSYIFISLDSETCLADFGCICFFNCVCFSGV